jgi:hypothetical protein
MLLFFLIFIEIHILDMKIQLDESQIKRLIGGYKLGLINEQQQEQPNTSGTRSISIDLGATFDSGKYKLTSQMVAEMKSNFGELNQFINQNPNAQLTIKVVAGESRVTNYDRERCKDGDFSNNCKLEPKVLSELRGRSIQRLLDNYLQRKELQNPPTFLPTETVLGSKSYTAGKDKADDPKYKEEQFVKLVISAEASYECLIGMKIVIAYDKTGHNCDEAVFQVLVNDVPLGVANLNNSTNDITNYQNFDKTFNVQGSIYQFNRAKIKQLNNYRKIYQKLNKELLDQKSERTIIKSSDFKPNIPELGLDGTKSITELGYTYSTFRTRGLIELYIDNIDFDGKIVYNPKSVITDEMAVKNRRLKPYVGRTMGDVETTKSPIALLSKIEGRKSDGQRGGKRSQTFFLDNQKAKTIVEQAPIKDRLVISLKPLVGPTGPYRALFNKGSHSDVPSVYITGKNGDKRYAGQPNAKMVRGSMDQKTILTTDLCGNKLSKEVNT